MRDLFAFLDEGFGDAGGWIRIVDADWFANDLKLNLSISFNDDRDPQLWEVACEGVVEESLRSNGTSTLTMSAHSPLLMPFVEPQVEIMFSQNTLAPEVLFGIVCSCCMEVMGRPESIPRFMNEVPTMDGISSSQYGLLGRFPESLATRILSALKDRPINVQALPGRPPKHWNGSAYVDYQPLQVLEIGTSYVVAQQFSACRA